MGKILEAYFLMGISITLLCFASGKLNISPTDVDQLIIDKPHNNRQRLTDDDSLMTIVEPRKHTNSAHSRQRNMAHIITANTNKASLQASKLGKYRNTKARVCNKIRQFLRKIRHPNHPKHWLSRVLKEKDNARKVIRRKSRDDGTYGSDEEDESIQSKDESDDEDVQLIIIPRKPRKHLRPKVHDEDEGTNESEDENNDRVSENSEDDSENDENSENSHESSEKPNFISKSFRQHINSKHKNSNDDATLTLERVASEDDDDDDSKNSHQSNAGDYDLHLKVKDKSGTNVKLSADLPGNIGNLKAVGEDGGKVTIQNTRGNSRAKTPEDLKTADLQGDSNDATTDELAQNLMKIKSGKLKHSPYPSSVLLKQNGGVIENSKVNTNGEATNQDVTKLKSQANDENTPQQLPANSLTSITRDEANAKAEGPSPKQQPSNNIFAAMEFENGDDELMATSRLLDIAQKADDASSLKEIKDPSNTVKEPASKPMKDISKGTSKAFLKSTPMNPADIKKQTEDIDNEANDDWYKMQSLEDRVVNEGNSVKTGKDVGSYNGTSPPIVLPDQTIHGTQRNHFEIHDLTDVSGGKWKAVHIPDEDITSMLQITNEKKKDGNVSLDIQHEIAKQSTLDGEIAGVQLPVEVHGRVHAFEHDLVKSKSKETPSPVGKLIVASESGHRGKDAGPLHHTHPSVIKLQGRVHSKEEEPKSREIIHQKGPVKPSLIVARIPEDDEGGDDSDVLPLRKLPTPIVASLRKTRPVIKPGSMRSNILASIIRPHNKRPVLLPSTQASNSRPNAAQRKSTPGTNNDPSVFEKIKSLLMKSHSNPDASSLKAKVPSKSAQNTKPAKSSLPAKVPINIPPATPILPPRPNDDGLFLPKFARPTNAFSNHESVLNRISSPKREALLLGIIKALLSRPKTSSVSPNGMNGAGRGLPHYNRQAIMQGLQNIQMSRTAHAQNDAPPPSRTNTGHLGMPSKNLEEMYKEEREDDVKKELARANEEAVEAKKMRQEESSMLANYDSFSNPESHNMAGNMGPQESQTPDGQVLSMLGPQQLNMLADNPSAT